MAQIGLMFGNDRSYQDSPERPHSPDSIDKLERTSLRSFRKSQKSHHSASKAAKRATSELNERVTNLLAVIEKSENLQAQMKNEIEHLKEQLQS